MGYIDLHDKPFDEGTKRKLEIFEAYTREWLPVFLTRKNVKVYLFDFFAGTGYDKNGAPGSPIRILQMVHEYKDLMNANNAKAVLYCNEYVPEKLDALKKACKDWVDQNPEIAHRLEIVYSNDDFTSSWDKLRNIIRTNPSLVFLDQNGVRFLNKDILHEFDNMKEVDFFFFISSSYVHRFAEQKGIKEYIPISQKDLQDQPYNAIHRTIVTMLKGLLPSESELKLAPFSIKKGSNIYGILFGAKHFLALNKFLEIAWKQNEQNGEADFDIDEDEKKDQLDIFSGKSLKKLEKFSAVIKEKILKGELKTNIDCITFALEQGHLCKHAAKAVKELKEANRIHYKGQPLMAFKNFEKKRVIEYKLVR